MFCTRTVARTVANSHGLTNVDTGYGLHMRGTGTHPSIRATGVDNQVVFSSQ
jgi:hypothetical protein